jgi:spore coat protein YsxE
MRVNYPPFSQGMELWDILERYGWEPTLVRYAGSVWRVATEDGEYALKRSNAPREKLVLLHQMLNETRAQGFPHLLPWVPTKRGEPVAEVNGEAWYATPWKGSRKDGQSKEPAAEDVVRALALFHRMTEPLSEKYPKLKVRTGESRLQRWKAKQEHLRQTVEEIRKKEYPTPFEQCLLREWEAVDRCMDFAIRGLSRFIEADGGESPAYALCHRRLHPSNVIADRDGFFFIDFDHAQFDSPARDLAAAIRRFTTGEDGADRAFALMEAYMEERPLAPKEKRLTALYLSYPERVLKTLRRYGEQAHLAGGEASISSRLEGELEQLGWLQEVVRSLWPRKKKTEKTPGSAAVSAKRGPGKAKPKPGKPKT